MLVPHVRALDHRRRDRQNGLPGQYPNSTERGEQRVARDGPDSQRSDCATEHMARFNHLRERSDCRLQPVLSNSPPVSFLSRTDLIDHECRRFAYHLAIQPVDEPTVRGASFRVRTKRNDLRPAKRIFFHNLQSLEYRNDYRGVSDCVLSIAGCSPGARATW